MPAARPGSTIQPVAVAPRSLEDLAGLLSPTGRRRMEHAVERAGRHLRGRVIWNVNTTARGGGVAEMLRSLVPYARATGVDVRWVVMSAEPDFYRVTKRLHNLLHGSRGDGGPLGQLEHDIYAAASASGGRELSRMVRPGDLVILHDPQTAGLARVLVELEAHVVWRAHIGADTPNDEVRAAWHFLLPDVSRTEAQIFSRAAYVWEGLDPERIEVIEPSIDPLTTKNHNLSPELVDQILVSAGILPGHVPAAAYVRDDGSPGRIDHPATLIGGPLPADAPIVTQVSRWDQLKDPIGVMDAFVRVVDHASPTHLALAGPDPTAVSDDPEGQDVFRMCVTRWESLAPEVRGRLHLVLLPMTDPEENAVMVNALQRRSTIVVQKSLAEGFGLTVSEAMWKSRPIVASRVGGIQDQIVDGKSGLLVEPRDLSAFGLAVRGLLDDPARAARMGKAAKARVRGHFLSAQHLTHYLELFERIIAEAPETAMPAPAADRR